MQPLTEGRDRIKEARIAQGFLTYVTSQIIKMQIIVLFLVMAVVAQAFRMRLVLPQTKIRARFRRFPTCASDFWRRRRSRAPMSRGFPCSQLLHERPLLLPPGVPALQLGLRRALSGPCGMFPL